jgi:hypothetical protein
VFGHPSDKLRLGRPIRPVDSHMKPSTPQVESERDLRGLSMPTYQRIRFREALSKSSVAIRGCLLKFGPDSGASWLDVLKTPPSASIVLIDTIDPLASCTAQNVIAIAPRILSAATIHASFLPNQIDTFVFRQ